MRAELPEIDLGELSVTLLAGTMMGLRDHLARAGFISAAELVADLVDITDDYLARVREDADA